MNGVKNNMMDNRELVVKGKGKTAAVPDLIVLNMMLDVGDPDYEKTMQLSTEQLDILRAAIVSAGHDGKKLKTTDFNINSEFKRERNKYGDHTERFYRYRCCHRLKLEFDLNMTVLGATLGAIAECDAKPNFNIEFSIKDPTAISEQLLESAVENAKWKATVLAKAAGVKLGEIKRIDYNWSEHILYSRTKYQLNDILLCEAATPRSMNIEPEDIDVSDTATVVWAIE
jgi:uncharacterized protein YggE